MMKIIIKMPSFLGDSIMTLSAVALVKQEYPSAELTIVCKEHSAEIFHRMGVHAVIIDDTKRPEGSRARNMVDLLGRIRQERYDLGILFHNTLIDALLFRLARIQRVIGYDKENRKFLLDFSLKIDRTRHYINHYANLVNQYFGNKYTELPEIRLPTYKCQKFVKDNKPIVGFVLGGENKGTRRYPKELGLSLFKLMPEEYRIVFLGDQYDNINHCIYEEALREAGRDVINLSGQTTVGELIDCIATLDLLVTIDTSAMHIAAGVGTKFIVLVGKGSSAFDTVYPKVIFGQILFRGSHLIRDEDLIYAIAPEEIVSAIKMQLKGE